MVGPAPWTNVLAIAIFFVNKLTIFSTLCVFNPELPHIMSECYTLFSSLHPITAPQTPPLLLLPHSFQMIHHSISYKIGIHVFLLRRPIVEAGINKNEDNLPRSPRRSRHTPKLWVILPWSELSTVWPFSATNWRLPAKNCGKKCSCDRGFTFGL